MAVELLLSLAISGTVVLLSLAYWLRLFATGRLNPKQKAVLVTGCDTGFGQAIVRHLDSLGCVVFAGCLDVNGEGTLDLKESTSDNVVVIQMDVTKDKQVSAAFDVVKQRLANPKKGLWGLVNNAGLANYGLIEWCSMDDYERITNVNFLGGVRVIKMFLPLIRKAEGRIVNTISILGRKATFGRSCYVASKHAMEGFTQCLRLEMKPWNVRVSIIEPGNFVVATGIFTKDKVAALGEKLWDNMSDDVRQEYGKEQFNNYIDKMMGFVTGGCQDKMPVIRCVSKALFDKRPRIRYSPKAWDEHVLSFIMTHFPHEIADFIYGL